MPEQDKRFGEKTLKKTRAITCTTAFEPYIQIHCVRKINPTILDMESEPT